MINGIYRYRGVVREGMTSKMIRPRLGNKNEQRRQGQKTCGKKEKSGRRGDDKTGRPLSVFVLDLCIIIDGSTHSHIPVVDGG